MTNQRLKLEYCNIKLREALLLQESLEHKLTRRQNVDIACNKILLLLQVTQTVDRRKQRKVQLIFSIITCARRTKWMLPRRSSRNFATALEAIRNSFRF